MKAQPDHTAQDADFDVDFDAPAQKGWSYFTKFLFWNIVMAAGGLIVIAALTVWR